MCLYDAPTEVSLRILDIHPACEAKHKLISMGIQSNDILIKLNNPNSGPVLVQNMTNGSSKLAIGKKLAESINVEQHQ